VGTGEGATVLGDRDVGLRRARAATLLMLALPGSAYLYQGEELGLPEVVDLPADARQDPIFARTGGTMLGRDGCRVPLPWSGDHPPYGFGPDGSTPWLPQPAGWAELSVEAQDGRPSSTLSLYRRALKLRRELAALGDGELRWRSEPGSDVLVFERPAPGGTKGGGPEGLGGGVNVVCAVNLGASPVQVGDGEPLLASDPLTPDGLLPPDVAAWWLLM
jgi:alpha-glucosidase